MAIRCGVSMMTSDGFRAAVTPLVEDGLVDAVERTIDSTWVGGWSDLPDPAWADALAELFAEDDALYGHGVWFSGLSAGWQARQARWLDHLAAECRRRRYRHVSEHFGYFSSGRHARFTNLTVPACPAAIELAVERSRLLADAVGAPVGLENTGVTLSPRDAHDQAGMLTAILDQTGGFLLLDVHNVWTQAVNLGVDPRVLVDAMPLDRVREVHVAGGVHARCRSGPPVYLDSHDGPVPTGAFQLLAYALPRCPAVEVVFFERRDGTWDLPGDVPGYQADYRAIHQIVQEAT